MKRTGTVGDLNTERRRLWEGHQWSQNYSYFTIYYLHIHSPAETLKHYTPAHTLMHTSTHM